MSKQNMEHKNPLKKKIFFPIIIILLFMTFLLFLVFCRRIILRKKTVKQEDAITQNLNSSSGQVLPSDFPSDFPIYQDSKILNSWSEEKEGITGLSVVWSVEADINKVKSFFQEQLTKDGWTFKVDAEELRSVSISFQKDKREGFLGIAEEKSDSVIVTIAIGIK